MWGYEISRYYPITLDVWHSTIFGLATYFFQFLGALLIVSSHLVHPLKSIDYIFSIIVDLECMMLSIKRSS